ncbi:histidine kinase [Microbispora hainanensis]|uniref:sensor histidine kinase n=1 Tax=Microbispora TaxID=2005 RepID=UPI001156EAAF|nr:MULTISPECIES: histidine kinase [Microbispora]NJP29887.1 sensor histidine kinase [Microbispora sp. CL1-1]TQS03830.1 sensor histidine kinase [Microbispora sp. SCL1-1]
MTADVRPGPATTRRDRAIRVGGVACALAAAAVVVHGDLGAASGWWLAVDVAGGAVACGALWLARRWPATMALVAVALAVPAASASVAAGIATLMTALYRRSAVAIAVGAAWVAATLARFWLRPPGLAPYPVWALVAVLFGVALTGWGMLARARRQLVLSLEERVRRAEEEQRRRVEQARHAERLAIAREMHDVLAHRLSLLALHAGALQFNARADPEEVVEAAAVVRSSAHQALQELRQVISVLREAPVLAELDLHALVEEVRQAGMEVEMRDGGVRLPGLPGQTARAAYRIVQEGLTNARKHAPGRPVTVRLDGGPEQGLAIEVRNPVVHAPRGEGAGLAGMRERAELAGGRVEQAGMDNGEFRLAVWLPWPV